MNKLIVAAIFAALGIASIFSLSEINNYKSNVGSVSSGNEYQGTTTYRASGAVNVAKDSLLKDGSGAVGNVLITGAVAGSIILYDANTADASTTALGASSTLAIFPASTAAGTYQIDRLFYRGLLVSFSSATAVPTSTITWR